MLLSIRHHQHLGNYQLCLWLTEDNGMHAWKHPRSLDAIGKNGVQDVGKGAQ